MISAKTIEVVKATVPAIKEHGEAITNRMYDILFERYYELQALFVGEDQVSGAQQKRLAQAILAYAQNIDNLDALGDAVAAINRRHVDAGVKPEHYGLVAECLLDAIRDVLGAAATDEVMAAWAEAYTVLAGLFIKNERALAEKLMAESKKDVA